MKRKPYPSDLTDAQWAVLQPLLPRARPGGRPRKTDPRDVLDALWYLNRTGCTWRALPHDFPPWKTVYNYFQDWTRAGLWPKLLARLRPAARTAAGREPAPRVAAIDSQSVKTAEGGEQRGTDGGKKVRGRKRHILVDSLGFVLAVVITAANVDDGQAAQAVFAQVRGRDFPRLELVYGDNKYHNYALYEWLVRHQRPYGLEIVRRPADQDGFQALPKRWVVERTFAWLGRSRRLSKDYEHTTASSEAMVQLAALHHLLRRVAPRRLRHSERFRFKRPPRKRAA
jgi:putative transposase